MTKFKLVESPLWKAMHWIATNFLKNHNHYWDQCISKKNSEEILISSYRWLNIYY